MPHKPEFAAQHRFSESAHLDSQLQELAASTWHIPYVSLYQAICHGGTCTEYADAARTVPMLTDSDHFTEPGSLYVMRKVVEQGELQ